VLRGWLAGLAALCAGSLWACTASHDGTYREPKTQPIVLPDTSQGVSAPGRVLLVSIAGLQARHYRAGAEGKAPMPQLAGLAAAGVAADFVEPVTPSITYPVHASLVTGLPPDRHGVVADRLLGQHGVRPVPPRHASRLQATTLWQAAQEAGLQVISLAWPSTLGASIDLLLPGVDPLRSDETWMKLLAGATTPWLFELVSARAALPEAAEPGWPEPRQRDELLVDIACEVSRAQAPPQLWLVRLTQTRLALDRWGLDGPKVSRAFARADALLGRLLHCFGQAGLLDSTAVAVVGDAGSGPVHTRIDPNVILAREGLVSVAAPTGVRRWSALARSNGGSAFVYARGEAEAVAARSALAEEGERTRAFRVVSAAELQELRADPQAWFGLEAAPGYGFGNAAQGPVQRAARVRSTSGYLGAGFETGFVAWGAGLRRSLRVPRMRQVDVAPTLAALLGVQLPEAEGQILIGLFDADPRTSWNTFGTFGAGKI
jgi:predicted AlkP superfamily pyrophosphatase or phosphodiesterase